MHSKPLFALVVFFLLCSLILGACTPNAPKATPTSTNETPTLEATAEPTSGAINNVDDAEKAVVRIVAEGTYQYPDFTEYTELGSGSGFIIDPSGIAVTNNHVVTGAARIKVYFSGDDKAYSAKVLGVSECSDLAVIDIEGDGYPYLDWYSQPADLGLTVYSLGYPLGDPNFTRHKGEISKEKTSGNTSWTAVSEVIEHDAIINPGNSGGPLVTSDAKVVGVNYAGASQYDQYYSIPALSAKGIVEQLRTGSDVDSLGINGEALVSDDGSFSGLWVYSVDSGSNADKSGIKAGDFLTSLEGIQLGRDGTVTDYCDVIRSHQADATLNVELIRFSTGEIMTGQINGRELEATGTIDGSTSGGNTSGSGADYFTDNFDNTDLSNWDYFYFGNSKDDFDFYVQDSQLIFDIKASEVYVYMPYLPYTYTDVRVDALVENQGTNNNAFSLFCRYTPDVGWYEFNVSSGGLWSILRYDEGASKFNLLYNGGSNSVNMGRGVQNTFSLVCSSNQISVYINDKLMRTVTDSQFTEGMVGISASSFQSGAAKVGFDAVSVSQP